MAAGSTSAGRTTGRPGDDRQEILAPGHARLLDALLPACEDHHLALAGAAALRVHGLDLPVGAAEDLELVTAESTPVAAIADTLAAACRDVGWTADPQTPGTPLLATLRAGPPELLETPPITVVIAKKPLRHPPTGLRTAPDLPVPVVSREDAACLTVTAMTDRTLADDLLALHTFAAWYGEGALPAMAGSFDEDFHLRAFAERLDKLAALDDEVYQRRGMAPDRVGEIKRWALAWAHDITLDLMEAREEPDSYYRADYYSVDAAPGLDADADEL